MIAVIQRVTKASVSVNTAITSEIGKGYVILLGIFEDDTDKDIQTIVDKITHLRVMADDKNKMNLSITDTKGELLLVSQFTLCGDTSQRRPSFIRAMEPGKAKEVYTTVIEKLKQAGIPVKTGSFGIYMQVAIHNDGPVTILLDSKK